MGLIDRQISSVCILTDTCRVWANAGITQEEKRNYKYTINKVL